MHNVYSCIHIVVLIVAIMADSRNEEGTPLSLVQWPILAAHYFLVLAQTFLLQEH